MHKAHYFIFIALSLILIGCGTTAPQPPVIPYCPIVAVEGGKPYLYCQWSNGQGEKWRVPISELPRRKEKYVCSTDQGYKDAYNYGQELNRWIQQHCQ